MIIIFLMLDNSLCLLYNHSGTRWKYEPSYIAIVTNPDL
jgi:hypothetical protein